MMPNLAATNLPLDHQDKSGQDSHGIIGHSPALRSVLAEVEQMTLAEIGEIVGANANTVATRLRAARQAFEKALARFQARELGRR